MIQYFAVKSGVYFTLLVANTGQQIGHFATQRAALAYADKLIAEDREVSQAARWLDGFTVA